jgi:uncharacterized repeat protein (TIGR03847 family)
MRSLGRPDRCIAGATGEPGRRTFLIEVASAGEAEWFALEKEQVAALAARALEMLREMGVPPGEPGPDLGTPGAITFRVGEIGIGRRGSDFVITLSPTTDADAEPVSFTLTPRRLGAMVGRALAVVAAGRPLCSFCGLPKDPQAHACPASNGDLRHR